MAAEVLLAIDHSTLLVEEVCMRISDLNDSDRLPGLLRGIDLLVDIINEGVVADQLRSLIKHSLVEISEAGVLLRNRAHSQLVAAQFL